MKTPKFLRQLKFLVMMVIGIIRGRAAAKNIPYQSYEYAVRDGSSLQLDLFLPDSIKDSKNKVAPLIIWFHGGGWQMGSRESIELAAVKQVARGYALASVSYSFSDVAVWPTQLHEAKAAVRWLRANAERFGLDADQFIAWGMSAGGHMACMLGVSSDVNELNGDLGDHSSVSTEVQGVIALYPPTDFLQMENNGVIDHFAADSPTSKLLGEPVNNVPDKAKLANPIAYCSESSPPFLIMHGTSDPVVPLSQSKLLYHALNEKQVDVKFHIYPNYTHGDFRFSTGERLHIVERYLDDLVGAS